METFEDFLQEYCPSSYITNNSNEGYEKWLDQLDINEVIDYAEQYGIRLRNNYNIKNIKNIIEKRKELEILKLENSKTIPDRYYHKGKVHEQKDILELLSTLNNK